VVHSPPRPTDVDLARARAKSTFRPYRTALAALPEAVRTTITAYTGALSAESAAQRNRAARAEAALETRRAERRAR
jgi:hypothetical protein